MTKKADVSLWFLIELLAAAFVAYTAVDVATSYAQGTIYEKLSIAKDISIQIDSIFSVPGDAYLVKYNPNAYSIRISGTKAEVFENGVQSNGIYYFSKNKNANLDTILEKPDKIVISKINGKITVSNEIPAELR